MRAVDFDRNAGVIADRKGPDYGRRGTLRDYKLVLSAGVAQRFSAGEATSLTLIRTSSTTPVTVRFDSGSSSAELLAGEGIDDNYLGDIEIECAASQTVTVRLSTGYQRNQQTVTVNANATVQNANTCKAVPDVSVTATTKVLVIAANANRKTVLIKSLSSNTAGVRLGDNATVAAGVGLQLDPGETATLDTEAAVYAFGGASAATLTITELERV